ncbi:hypothetical protein KR074_000734, partial [Drosophila pseudoananassae]
IEEVMELFLITAVVYFCANLKRPPNGWGYFDCACPIVMGILSAGLIHINV